MKNLSLILNVVLIVAVGALYVMKFSSSNAETKSTQENKRENADYSVVYINADSLLVNYDFFNEIQAQLQEKGTKLDQEYQNRAQGLQREVNDYQKNVNNLTIGQAKALEEDLIKKQQNLRLYQENLSQQLMKEEAKLNKELYDKVTNYLKEYCSENNIDLVVKYNQGSDVLYANDGMDITKQVIEGLNNAHKNQTNGSEMKADSTKTE